MSTNDIHDEIKSRLNSGNACYYSVQNILSSRLISKKHKDCDPCTWHPLPPVRVDAPRKTIPKFSSKLKYGPLSQLGARGQDGQTD
jgi:hypothetical protein